MHCAVPQSILVKNFLDFCITTLTWWLLGWSLAFGDNANNNSKWFAGAITWPINGPDADYATFFFQGTFASASATIISGAVAERSILKSYLTYTAFVTSFVYPVLVHWAWSGDGWLAALGFHDFAGSGVVHACGGLSALVFAKALGPRIGRFGLKEGQVYPMKVRSWICLAYP